MIQESMSLTYEPALVPLHIFVKWLFLKWELPAGLQDELPVTASSTR